MADGPDWRRRGLLAGGALAAAAWVWGAPRLASLGGDDFAFADIPGLAPFRRLAGARPGSTGSAILTGIGPEPDGTGPGADLLDAVRADPCAALFGTATGAGVPVAMFSDFACPVCRVMDARLHDLAAEGAPFHIVRHQLPILGRASDVASRAVLAADLQGGYDVLHDRLIRTPAVTDPAYVAAVAGDVGLDATRLAADMASEAIGARLSLSAAAARVFGFYGTPAFAVGRTVFMGAQPEGALRRLIALEDTPVCASA